MVGIIILNYNNYLDTINCVESVLKWNTANVKFIIVDNASNEKCQNEIKKHIKRQFISVQFFKEDDEKTNNILTECSYISCNKNKGYAQGNNEGFKLAYQDKEIDYIMILNNDILFVQDIISPMCTYLDKLPDAGIVSPLLLKKNGSDIDYNCARKNVSIKELFLTFALFFVDPFHWKRKLSQNRHLLKNDKSILNQEVLPIELPSGSCMLMKKSLWKTIDGFDPHTFLYYEENILYKKLLKNDKRNYMLPQLKCIHLGASSIQQEKSYFILKHSVNSAQYYLNKYADVNLIMKWCFLLIKGWFMLQVVLIKLLKRK